MRINELFYKEHFLTDAPDAAFFDVRSTDAISVHGLCGGRTERPFKRLPDALARSVSEKVALLYTNTAGGRLRFRTDSDVLYVRATVPGVTQRSIITMLAQAGFSVYVSDGGAQRFVGALHPPIDLTDGYMRSIVLPQGEKDVTVYMPLFNDVDDVEIGVRKGAALAPARPYAHARPILFYGSSVTQGASVSRPGMTYEAILSRALDTDYINLGFASAGKAEDAIVDYMAGLDFSIFVCDYDYNAPDADYLAQTHERMYKKIRAAHPDAPFLMTTKPVFYERLDTEENRRRREIIRRTYDRARESGDDRVFYIDGRQLFADLPSGDACADTVHPNDLGAAVIARRMIEIIREEKLL